MRDETHPTWKAALARKLAALGAIAFGLVFLAELLLSLYRLVPLSCETGCDDRNNLLVFLYMVISWATIWLAYVAVRRCLRCAAGDGGGSRALAAGAANLVLYSLWWAVPLVWDGLSPY